MAFLVTIKRTIETVVEVDAGSVTEARRLVKQYGETEAISDFPLISETAYARVTGIEPRA